MERMQEMRANYLKENIRLREVAYKTEKNPENYEYMSINYFSGLEITDEGTRNLLNARIEDTTKIYNEKLGRLHKKNVYLVSQIQLYESLGKEAGGLSIKEMNAQSIIDKLHKIETDPEVIWDEILLKYGETFFDPVIQSNYGINLNNKLKVSEDINQQLNEF